MLRRNVRLRKEYLYKKNLEDQANAIAERKRKLKEAHEKGHAIPPELRQMEKKFRSKMDLEDENTLGPKKISQDCEYAYAGLKDPVILVTTSHSPSRPCQVFAKELKLFFPNSHRINRGNLTDEGLVRVAAANGVTDIVETSGSDANGFPTLLTVCHLPFGPTAQFQLADVVMRHDLPAKPKQMSLVNPHLIFHNVASPLGERLSHILKYLFPPPSSHSHRVLAFVNHADKIVVRHYNWTDSEKGEVPEEEKMKRLAARSRTEKNAGEFEEEYYLKTVELEEVGPRFVLVPFKIVRGTIGTKVPEVEWVKRSFINKTKNVLG